MPSQFFGLNISYTGLTAANAALNTTANNISNVETEGYSRQKVTQEASNALRTYTTYGCAGAGVDTVSIDRIRDEFYDGKFWANKEKLGESEVKAYYMKSIENYFSDTDKVKGFNTSFNLMFNALEELSKDAGAVSAKSQFIMYAQSLCDYFNSISNQLTELQKDVNTEIKDCVSTVNSIAEQIATLNKQINVIELTKVSANELRDKRAVLIDELSQYVSVETIETPIYDTANNYDTGANRYQVLICGGQTLVDTNAYNTLECVSKENNETINQSDALGLYNIKWTNGVDFNLYSNMVGGRLQGLIEMRDGNNKENFTGTVSKVDDVNNIVEVTVDYDYLKDLDKCTLSEHGGIISLGVEDYYYTDWDYKLDSNTGECTYTFYLDANYGECTLSTTRLDKTANVGVAIDYQGIPYYQEQLNEFARLFARTFNNIVKQDGVVDGYGNAPEAVLLGNDVLGSQYTFKDYYAEVAKGTGVIELNKSDDSYYKLTAANFSVNWNIEKDADLLGTHRNASAGDSKADIIQELIAMKTDKTTLSFRGASASEFLQSVLSDAALNAARANNSVSYYETMDKTINNQRQSISGVDTDEEAVDLVKYQNAYNLASRMIQMFTEIYDRLILQTGV